MKKHVLAVAALLACAAASAQSSVTIFGIIDAGVARTSATGSGHSTGLASGGNATSRLGFRGTEDLGGGLAASFWLEGQLNNDVGSGATQTTGLDFVRRSTVSLSGNFGEVRLGRDYSPIYLNMNQFDIWGQRGLGTVETTGSSRAGVGSYARTSNGIAYFLPGDLGGVYGTVQYAFGEQPSTQAPVANAAGISASAANAATHKTGNAYGGRVGYASGPLDVSAAFTVFQNAVRTVGASFYGSDYTIANLGASYDLGVIKPRLLYQSEKIDGRGTLAAFRFNTLAIGATAPIGGAGLLRAQVARYKQSNTANDFNKYSVGYVYSLSKRTQVYADLARLNNKGAGTVALNSLSGSINSPAPTPGGHSTGYIVGIKHAF
ncbi:MAG: porin [Pseudomonadota bacterium]